MSAPARERFIQILQNLPEDSTGEQLLRELYFTEMIERGIKDADSGRVISQEEMKRQIREWRH